LLTPIPSGQAPLRHDATGSLQAATSIDPVDAIGG
jgi:hypothetical protein